MILRDYQCAAVAAVYDHLRARDDNPCVVIPTAGGKTPVIATICKDAVGLWNGRVLILAHVKELLEQAADKLNAICPEVRFGVYSAGLKRKDRTAPVIVAGIQSIWKRACEFDPFDLVIVDECVPAGTMIATPTGEVSVEALSPGDYVRHALGVGEILATVARPAADLVTLEFADGTTLTCTAGHPIFTACGWIAAGELERGALAFGVEDVRVLRDALPALEQDLGGRAGPGHEGAAVDAPAILLDLLLQEAQQPDERCGDKDQDASESDSERTSTESARRERTPVAGAAEVDVGGARCGLGGRVHRFDQVASSGRVADALQAGPGRSPAASGHRDRRPLPRLRVPAGAGSAEDRLPGGKRVVRVTHHERTSPVVVYNLQVAGHPSYFADGVLVHNCHLIPLEGDGMYRQFLDDARAVNPNLRVIGCTATPYRLKSGSICTPDGFLNHVCYEVGVRELIVQGYLCPLVTKAGINKPDVDRLHVHGGEYVAGEVEDLMDQDNLVEAACGEMVGYTGKRNAVLIFASGVKHGEHIVSVLKAAHGIDCGFVTGDTPVDKRDATLARFKAGELKYLCNVNVLTTGFDAPHIDCVALLRPTLSPGLYYQMVGRGFRLHASKANCLVLDFGGNVLRHGPVDQIRVKERDAGSGPAPAKECPECHAVVAAGYARCPECGFEFPPPERTKHEAKASEAGILSGQITTTKHAVRDVTYSVHTKRGANAAAPKSLRVDYKIGWHLWKSEWVCLEHDGFARQKAVAWWKKRSREPVPATAAEAVEIADAGGLASTTSITVRSVSGQEYDRITDYQLSPIPDLLPRSDGAGEIDFPFGANAAATEEEIPW